MRYSPTHKHTRFIVVIVQDRTSHDDDDDDIGDHLVRHVRVNCRRWPCSPLAAARDYSASAGRVLVRRWGGVLRDLCQLYGKTKFSIRNNTTTDDDDDDDAVGGGDRKAAGIMAGTLIIICSIAILGVWFFVSFFSFFSFVFLSTTTTTQTI